MTPIILGLRVDLRIAVYFAGRGLKNSRLYPFGESQHIDRTMHAGFRGLDRIKLIVNRRCRAGEVIDFVHLNVKRKGDIMPHQFEAGIVEKLTNIIFTSSKEIVDTQDVVSLSDQPVAKV